MDEHCCDRMKYFVNKKIIEVDKGDYYLVWNDWHEVKVENQRDQLEILYYCPFCGVKLGDD